MQKQPYGTVLMKADKILQVLSRTPKLSLQEIATQAEMTTPTTLKILETLGHIGYVKRNDNKTYELGVQLIRYANTKLTQMELSQVALPYLEQLQEKVNETIHLGLYTGDEVMYIHKLEPHNRAIRMTSKVGITRPLYSSAMGKAILSHYEKPQLEQYFQTHSLEAFTVHTRTQVKELQQELEEARKTQVAFDDEEMELDIFCVGASIEQNGKTIGAFSVSSPKYRVTPEVLQQQIQDIQETKQRIEAQLS